MENKVKQEETLYLEQTQTKIKQILDKNKKKIKSNTEKVKNLKTFFSENFYDIKTGSDELADINTQIENFETQSADLEKTNRRLARQEKTPYFGRFDFQSTTETQPQNYYIGLGLVQDEEKKNLVYDWRSDICSLYYDDAQGKCSYTCPDGEITGTLSLKRQYKIEDGKLQYYIDSKMIIDDDILMEQLSQNSSGKMHDIVSTIQKEQNALIRSDDFQNQIVQGVAGSGKTSVALHRISYLLYKYKNSLKSEDILIMTPSEAFGEYIDDVLPNLGEEKPFSTTFNNMAKRLLSLPFEPREELLERIIENQKQSDFENIAIKSSFEFLDALKNFLDNDLPKLFVPKTMTFGDVSISKEDLTEVFFNKLSTLPIHKRIEVLSERVADMFKTGENDHSELVKRAKKLLYDRFMTTDLIQIYNNFLMTNDLDQIETIGAYDIAPIMLIKENLLSLKNTFASKYVIVDEMQDYTPCHFYLFEKIFKCPKLYLGDIYQSIDRTLSADYLTNLSKLVHAKIKVLNRSYRSTLQISTFSQKILGKKIANNVNRSGDEIKFIKTKDCTKSIEDFLKDIPNSQRVAIICKTQSQISTLKKSSDIIKKFKDVENTNARKLITTPAKAKGIEFDVVIIPFADDKTYKNQLDQNLLYVSSTRALHKLCFIASGKPSIYLTKTNE